MKALLTIILVSAMTTTSGQKAERFSGMVADSLALQPVSFATVTIAHANQIFVKSQNV